MRTRKRRKNSYLLSSGMDDRFGQPTTDSSLIIRTAPTNIKHSRQHDPSLIIIEYHSDDTVPYYQALPKPDYVQLPRHKRRTQFCLPATFVKILYLIFCYSLLGYHENHRDLSTAFTYSRLQNYFKLIQPVSCEKGNYFKYQQPPVSSMKLQLNNQPRLNLPELITNQGGVINDKNITLTKLYNPIIVTKDIVIKKNAKLTIESGTEILFDKKKGIIVYGALEVLGNSIDKVKLNLLKSHQSATINFRSHNNIPIKQQQIRLVDGDLPSEGRVQIKFNNRWHSLCTSSKNLTAADIKVLCHQVGYQEGQWYKWFTGRNETVPQIMSKSFMCSGSETAINQCKRWNRVRSGGGICDYHSDIGIRCSRTMINSSPERDSPYEYWRGIEFINSDTISEYVLGGQMRQKISKSQLHHVILNESGINEAGNATAAIRVHGQPPMMTDIEIKNSVYGIIMEDVDDAIRLSNIRLHNNIGYPLFINTSWGKVILNNMRIENNGGDGIRVVRHEKTLIGSHDFCKFANLGASQSFPVVLSHEQTFFTVDRDCCQEFISNHQLTVRFPVLRSTPNNLLPEGDNKRRVSIPPGISIGKDAHLVIYDDYRDEFPFRLTIQNGTRAQSIVSKSGRLKICYEPANYRTVLFTVEIVADYWDEWTGIARDVIISDSYISDNQGRGIWIDNPRSGVKIRNTTVLNHNYVGGVHVENGTGEVIVQGSTISNNTGHGIFINLAGGYYHIDNSTISDNTLTGIMIDYDRRPELVPFNHTFHFGYSLVMNNGQNGLYLGNPCRFDPFWNISMNSFIKNEEDAIVFQSCLPTSGDILSFKNSTLRFNSSDPHLSAHNNYQELYITHNTFLANDRRSIKIAPVFFLKCFIRHNTFKEHPLAALYISNQEIIDTTSSNLGPVNIRIASNRFYANRGRYVVNIGVQEDNMRQSLTFTKNTLIENHISEPYGDLKPRSKISAVLVISSSNAKVFRNRFDNPLSNYELGCHLAMHHKIINATANFWGLGLDAGNIYKRIFDRKNRYNLAQVEFLQYLLSPEDLEYGMDLSFDRERDKISTFKNGTHLGGEVKGYEELNSGTYIVHNDLFVRSGAHLILKPGTVLKFDDGVGMMVQGRLDAIGQANSQILFTSSISANRLPQRAQVITTPTPYANPWVSHQPEGGREEEGIDYPTRSIIRKRNVAGQSVQNVRLSHTTMGRLEVQIDGIFGPVCDYNFDIHDAAVVCQQLGMILNKDDWLLEKFQYAENDQQQISMMSNNVLMTNVRCDPSLDTDITKCKAEISSRGDFDGMCNSEVGIRCFPPSWSGLRFGMGAETSTLEHCTIQKAGMFDYSAYSLKPALQIDFNRHWLSSLTVKLNSDSGLGIMWSDVIGRHFSELSLINSKFHNNERHGIELRSKGLSVKGCSISNNRQIGIDYNPSFSQTELNDLISWLQTEKNSDSVIAMNFPLQNNYFSVSSSEDAFRFFIFQKAPQANVNGTFIIGTDPGHMLSIHLLNPIHLDSTESLNMSLGLNPESPVWDFRVNMTSFPMISPGYKFHFNYSAGSKPRGNMVLYIRSRYNNRDLKVLSKHIPSYLIMNKFDQTAININTKLLNSLVIANSNFTRNGIGLKFQHPNFSYGSKAEFNLRYANETTNITNNMFDSNQFSCIYVESGNHDIITGAKSNKTHIPASEIYYYILGNRIRRNKDGIRQFDRNLRDSNNVFHWSINDTSFEFNRGGGISIVLPYYWQYDANLSHTLELSNNSFLKNSNFEFSLDGHYAVLNITRNLFKENRCKINLLSLNGMEKKMRFENNIIEQNMCNQVIDFNIQSHADQLGHIPAVFEYNSIRYNRKQGFNVTYINNSPLQVQPRWISRINSLSNDCAICLRGVQSLNISRNLFVNPELRFEMVAAIMMDDTDSAINASENYWGSVYQSDIDGRIFDFNDWNNFAIVSINPYLNLESFSAATIKGESKLANNLYNKGFGGRIDKSMTLTYRKEPYVIESDLTVMPNVILSIEKGVVLEFMPSVGILVLGDLVAAGTRDRPIQMRPVVTSSETMSSQQLSNAYKTRPSITQTFNFYDPTNYENYYALRHYQLAYPIDLGSIRLCKNEICNDGSNIYENNVEDPTLRQEVLKSSNNSWKMDGFLELYNMTTLQWVPVCDPLFTENAARVVCRHLGYTHLSLFRRGRRYTIEQERVMSIRNWPGALQCDGTEASLSNCALAQYGFANHSSACSKDSNQFVYIFCRDFPETSALTQVHHGQISDHSHYWGGIRFSCPSSSNPQRQDYHESYNMIGYQQELIRPKSKLQYVTVDRAGMLHRRKSPAVQIFQCPIQLEYVAITNSAHHGLEVIAANGNQNFHQLRLRNNLGIGLNYLSLTGSSSASRLVPYLPLKRLDISSDVLGFVDICGATKEILIEERLLLFYRYSSRSVDCIKIISSKMTIKHIGLRMLQFDLFNSTSYSTRADSIRIYDGNIFDRDARQIVEFGVSEKHRVERPELKFYQTTDSTMSIRLHASGAGPMYGFIAEFVTTPVTYSIQRDSYNNITFSEIVNNKLGAINVASAGESSSNLILKGNRFESNCLHLFGNFTSCISPIYMELQNCQRLKIINNLIKNNQGGIMIKSYSHSAVSALEASVENNVFEGNQNTNILALLGPKSDPYQTVKVSQNFFTRNAAEYLSNIVLSRIVSNFSYNIISGNTGKHQIEVVGFDKLPLSYQTFSFNWIYNNTATLERDRSTIFGNSAGQQYFMNYLVNPDNHFEISTMNWSKFDVKPFHIPRDDEIIHLAAGDGSSVDVFRKIADSIPINIMDTKKNELYHATINAKYNWWGFNTTIAIQNRIRDRIQHEELIKVEFNPFLETNRTVLSGICSGGWQRVDDACLVYVGSRMTYFEAKEFCDKEMATLPLISGNHYEITDFIRSQDRDFDPQIDRAWVRSFDVSRDACPALSGNRIRNYDCQDKYTFICEKDPLVVVNLLHWHRETGGLIALALASITFVLTFCCTICWGYKSRERHKEKIKRKSTIYASMRSNRIPYSTSNSLSELSLHRQIYNPTEKSSITDLSLLTQITQPSDHFSLVRTDPNYGLTIPGDNLKMRRSPMQSDAAATYYTSKQRKTFVEPTTPSHPATFSMNPAYESPSLRATQYSPASVKSPTPAPSYREVHARAIPANGSITPSYSSSQIEDVFPEPMPVINAPSYSQINHVAPIRIINDRSRANSSERSTSSTSQFDFPTGPQLSMDPNGLSMQSTYMSNSHVREMNGSDISSVPTHYSNQLEHFDSTQSYLEAYHEAYKKTIHNLNGESNHHNFFQTEKSTTSITDYMIQTSSQLLNTSKLNTSATVDDRTNLVSMKPQGSSGFVEDAELNVDGGLTNRAYSEIISSSRYLVETSFDDGVPIKSIKTQSAFGSSQQLSPVSPTFAQPDSKLGSRVYLETSFE